MNIFVLHPTSVTQAEFQQFMESYLWYAVVGSLVCFFWFCICLFLFILCVCFLSIFFFYYFCSFLVCLGFFSHEWLQKQLGQLKEEGGKCCSKGLWMLKSVRWGEREETGFLSTCFQWNICSIKITFLMTRAEILGSQSVFLACRSSERLRFGGEQNINYFWCCLEKNVICSWSLPFLRIILQTSCPDFP